ncbi:MAG: APC family permease [Anaerovoracaceae bacterium]
MEPQKKGLARELGLSECITITAGAVIGVGLFTVGSSQVGVMGSSVIIASVIAFLLVLWPSAIYGELGATLPLAGGTYSFAKRAINWPVAIFCSWHYTIAQIGIAGGEALAFASYFGYLLKALGAGFVIDPRVMGSILMIIFTLVNYRGIKFSGRWQNGFMFFFWGASLVWMIMVMKNLDFANFAPVLSGIPPTFTSMAKCIVMVWWCFAGFETCVGMGGEVKFPQITLPRALTLAPLVVFAVNALFQFFLVGLTPLAAQAGLATANAPFVQAMMEAGIVGFPFILLCLGITFGGDFSSMVPCTAGAARYMYIMAQDGCFPKIFARLHPKFRSPNAAVIAVGIIGILFISTNSIVIVSAMCAFSQMLCYIIGYISYLMLYKKEPDLNRPWKVPAGKFGAIFSIVVYTGLAFLAIDWNAIWWNIGLSVICILYIVFFVVIPKKPIPQEALDEELLAMKTAVPSPAEQASLDSQYKKWKIGAFSGFGLAIVLFILGFIL